MLHFSCLMSYVNVAVYVWLANIRYLIFAIVIVVTYPDGGRL